MKTVEPFITLQQKGILIPPGLQEDNKGKAGSFELFVKLYQEC